MERKMKSVFEVLRVQSRGLRLAPPFSWRLRIPLFFALYLHVVCMCAGQELSTIDQKHGRYYILGFNMTSSKPNLFGWNLKDHSTFVDMELDLSESAFVVRDQIFIHAFCTHACRRVAQVRFCCRVRSSASLVQTPPLT